MIYYDFSSLLLHRSLSRRVSDRVFSSFSPNFGLSAFSRFALPRNGEIPFEAIVSCDSILPRKNDHLPIGERAVFIGLLFSQLGFRTIICLIAEQHHSSATVVGLQMQLLSVHLRPSVQKCRSWTWKAETLMNFKDLFGYSALCEPDEKSQLRAFYT